MFGLFRLSGNKRHAPCVPSKVENRQCLLVEIRCVVQEKFAQVEAVSISKKLRRFERTREDDDSLTVDCMFRRARAKFGGDRRRGEGGTPGLTFRHTDRQTSLLNLYLFSIIYLVRLCMRASVWHESCVIPRDSCFIFINICQGSRAR